MPRKAGGPSKSKAIRDYKAAHKRTGPTAIAAALKSDGIEVTPQFVSTVLSNARRKGRKGKRGRRAGGAAGGNASLRQLLAAKKLAAKLGGVEKARQALDTLAKLLG